MLALESWHSIVVLDSLSKHVDLGFRGTGSSFRTFGTHSYLRNGDAVTKFRFCAQMHYGRLLPADQKLCRNVAGVTFTPAYIK